VSLPINSSQSLFAAKKASIFAAGFGFIRSLKFLDNDFLSMRRPVRISFSEIRETENDKN